MSKPLWETIDWSGWEGERDTCYCNCGAVYHSYVKATYHGGNARGNLVVVSKDPCPQCEKHTSLKRVSSPPETFTIRN